MLIKTNSGYLFDQLTGLLEQMSDDQYSTSLSVFSGATIGKHYRHIIEFFQSVSLADQTDTICYDNRLRDTRIESSRDFAMELLKDLQQEFTQIDNSKELTLIGDLNTEEGFSNTMMLTSLLREFHYAVEHAIHHMAILKMGIRQAYPELKIADEFGVAPSTLRYQATSAK